ncbi:signal transducer and transcription activator isoform X4 [Episyrphus balteatus]|uniref:signal transducer and transcription activator isoform X4 n=1 Tax=Episyrphus balteatus TaxID=286459 RepID=UPI0024863BDF|nr:signal transducer and transcription activator isoform X4 [Episyrphus balteatus]
MSLWARISSAQEPEAYMKTHYDLKGMYEIRVFFAAYIEERLSRDEKIPREHTALQFYKDLKDHIIDSARTVPMDFQYSDILNKMAQIPPLDFYSHLREGIAKEMDLITSAIPIPTHSFAPMGGMDQLEELYNRIQELVKTIDMIKPNIQKTCSEFDQIRTFCSTMNAQPPEMKSSLEERYTAIYYQRNVLVMQLKNIVSEYEVLHKSAIDVELKNWQRQQALAGNGAPLNDNLNQIQSCIELLVEIICKLAQLVDIMRKSTTVDGGLDELHQRIRMQQEYLILSAFIVEKQPPQVMKTNTRFAAAVRWLVGPQLGINMNSPNIECIILSEAQAQRHCTQRQMSEATPHSSGEILNNVGTMEYQQQSRIFSASFRNMQLKKIKRAEKKGTESVMDEKFALLFYTSVIVNDYRIRVWTLSLPVVVIVHGNQEPQSWATITWDNAFSEIVREPFQVPDRVSWARLADALYTKYLSATGRGPTEENKNFLYEKLFRNEYMMDQKDNISWTQFCKEPLPDRTFTFWDWFFSTMKLTKDQLVGPWKADLIVGFINKRTTEDILRRCAPGTFLLRFSDSELGGITVAFVREDGNVYMLAPWTAKDLNVRGLADRIQDLEMLKYVYPNNKNKDEAFGEFYSRTEEQGTKDGYVRNVIITTVPEMRQPAPNTTPNHAHSPNPNDIHMVTGDNLLFQPENNMDDILSQFAQNSYADGM